MENPEIIAAGITAATAVGGAAVAAGKWLGGVFTRMQENHSQVVKEIMADAVKSRTDFAVALEKLGGSIDTLGEKLARSRDEDRAMIVDLARRAPQCPSLAAMAGEKK